ncbi:MAG: hypothetical protein IT204_10615 [Fimbriimonadaceae bacterium]|nr:hypothetical protein [Fimbriimonadaceae bacterium]
MSQGTTGRPRPRLFRALGAAEPAAAIQVDGSDYTLQEVLKHDSWAASAIYHGAAGRIVVKWNRQQPILGLRTLRLGRWLANREGLMLGSLQHLPNVPRLSGPVTRDGQVCDNAIAHEFVEGHPLGAGEWVNDEAFPALQRVIEAIHAEGWAYVDLHKRENLVVDPAGMLYLIDFQICFMPGTSWCWRTWPVRFWLAQMQQGDRYHIYKHWCRSRPDQLPEGRREVDAYRPWFNRLTRTLGNPMRATRRRLLVWLGIRRGRGYSHSEAAPEDAVRRDLAQGVRPDDATLRPPQ